MGLPPELEFVFGETSTVFQSTRLLCREMIAENTLALTIERPHNFSFAAGQNMAVSIPGNRADDVREFTICSAPYEKDLMIAMRIQLHICYQNERRERLRRQETMRDRTD